MQNWSGFFKNNKKWKAELKVDDEIFEDTTFADNEEDAKNQLKRCWTLPEYSSNTFEILKIKKECNS